MFTYIFRYLTLSTKCNTFVSLEIPYYFPCHCKILLREMHFLNQKYHNEPIFEK